MSWRDDLKKLNTFLGQREVKAKSTDNTAIRAARNSAKNKSRVKRRATVNRCWNRWKDKHPEEYRTKMRNYMAKRRSSIQAGSMVKDIS